MTRQFRRKKQGKNGNIMGKIGQCASKGNGTKIDFFPYLTSSSTTSITTESTPYPPLTLSLGAWQITEEDLPIYVGSAAGVLLLIILLLGVTTWRCCLVPSHSALQSPLKSKDDSHSKFQIYDK